MGNLFTNLYKLFLVIYLFYHNLYFKYKEYLRYLNFDFKNLSSFIFQLCHYIQMFLINLLNDIDLTAYF